jgi:hypothetical protein
MATRRDSLLVPSNEPPIETARYSITNHKLLVSLPSGTRVKIFRDMASSQLTDTSQALHQQRGFLAEALFSQPLIVPPGW